VTFARTVLTANNINASETTFFVGVDTAKPSIFNLIPVSNTTFNVSGIIEISANVTDNGIVDTVLANITFPNSTIQQLTLSQDGSTDRFNNTFVIPNLIGQYNVTFIANDTRNNINSSETTFFVGIDVIPPSVFDLVPVANSTFNVSAIVDIQANVTDNVAVSTVLANVTFPNSTVQQLTLTKIVNTSKYNNTFTIPALIGQYNVTFIKVKQHSLLALM